MGLLDLIKDAGKDLFGGRQGNEGDAIEREIQRTLGNNVTNVNATFANGTVTLTGQAKSHAAKEKAALIAGNVRGVERVNDDGLTVASGASAGPVGGAAKNPAVKTDGGAGRTYTIQSGDTLSKIAKQHYGDANQWQDLFEANREVIEDADKIYPGQVIRIPADLKS
jgi:nucleoid-associated protein YgaU